MPRSATMQALRTVRASPGSRLMLRPGAPAHRSRPRVQRDVAATCAGRIFALWS